MESVFRNLETHVKCGDALVVGVSGGPDSTALLDLLAEFARKTPCRIIVAHVNHGIRGREALHDEKFVEKLAEKYGFKFEPKRVKLAGKTGLEERGRDIRREFFEKLRIKYNAKWIITAHTQDDRIETIIFNFLRGSGPRGLAGMETVLGCYLKPLLAISKVEVLQYLKSRKLKFCVDSTNADTDFSRNFIRRNLAPLIEKINPSYKKTLLRNAEIFKEIDEWLRFEAQFFLEAQLRKNRGGAFRAKDFMALPKALQQAVVQSSYRKFTGYPYQLPALKIEEILRMISRNIGKKKIITGCPAATFSIDKGLIKIS